MADSGAILTTLAPFPLHRDLIPPSFIIMAKPDPIPILFLLDACTYTTEPLYQSLHVESFCEGSSSKILICNQ